MEDCRITGIDIRDVRFPTSRTLAGSDAMNEAPDYSAAYVILDTDCGLRGHGMTFTIGRGTEIVRLTPRLWDGWWMGEPTNPDDIRGHAHIAGAVAPVRIATGEHCPNRTMFKQLMRAGGLGVCQLDACRLRGVNEVLAVRLLAARFEIPVCPHAGGVGLSEYVIRDGRYVAPDAPGYGIEMHPESLEEYAFPGGRAWS